MPGDNLLLIAESFFQDGDGFMVIRRREGKARYCFLSCGFQERLQIIKLIDIRELRILVYS